jgi:UDP-2,3-diacylglucosamine hydrolase
MPEAILFSDAHVSEDDPAGAARLAAFLSDVCPKAKRVFILGDLFDFWFGPSQARRRPYSSVLESLAALAASGVEVTFFHGNRDFYIDDRMAETYGFRLVKDFSIENVCGRRVLMCHGDMLCANDKNYHRMRVIVRSPAVRFILTRVPAAIALKLARMYRWWSKRAVSGKSQHVLGVDANAVKAHLAHGADVVVAGHTHNSSRYEIETPEGTKTVYMIGDFGTEGAYIECDREGFAFRHVGNSPVKL